MPQMLRWEVPLTGKDQIVTNIKGVPTGDVACVAPLLSTPYLEFWTLWDGDSAPWSATYKGFATGADIPAGYDIVGTADRVNGQVWHLFRKVT
jgi:hypothetical protein